MRRQINVSISDEEMVDLLAICAEQHITKPATLIGMWVRENLDRSSGMRQDLALVREARTNRVNVRVVLAEALRKAREFHAVEAAV